MSDLTDKIKGAIKENKTMWIHELDGTVHHIANTASVEILEGKGSDFISVPNDNGTTMYNLEQVKAIKIS